MTEFAPELGQPQVSDDQTDAEALQQAVRLFSSVPKARRAKLFRTIAMFFEQDLEGIRSDVQSRPMAVTQRPQSTFASNPVLSPKQFLLEKMPQTDIERVACLAFYLTHYREMPDFDAADINQLNTEAAQPKFSNPHWSVGNALKLGHLAPATTDGKKQLSAVGEQFVQALPDREAAKALMTRVRPRRGKSIRRASNQGDSNTRPNDEG